MCLRNVSTASLLAAALAALCAAPARASVVISIDKSAQQMTVSVDGATRYVWPVSTGRASYNTPNGRYKPFRMEADHYSKEWDDAPMPHSIFFTKIGHAIHGSFEVKNLGRPASHGCVRLAPANAAKLFALVKAEGLSATTVVVNGQLPHGSVPVARRRPPAAAETEAARAAPPSAQPGYAPPGYAQPGYAQPGYAPPGYAPPGYAQPDYGQPYYGQPPSAYPPQYAPPQRFTPY
jgi:hypothetical protein